MVDALALPDTKESIEALATKLCDVEERAKIGFQLCETPVRNSFAPGVYLRTILMPKGVFVIGAEHKTEHFNIVHTGRALVMMNGETKEIVAPAVFTSPAGVRKVLFIEETMEWSTVHPTDETDLERLEELLIVKSSNRDKYLADVETLKRAMTEPSINVGLIGGAP